MSKLIVEFDLGAYLYLSSVDEKELDRIVRRSYLRVGDDEFALDPQAWRRSEHSAAHLESELTAARTAAGIDAGIDAGMPLDEWIEAQREDYATMTGWRDVWRNAMQHLTPLGSEYTTPQECAAYITKKMGRDIPKRIIDAERERDEAQRENEKLQDVVRGLSKRLSEVTP